MDRLFFDYAETKTGALKQSETVSNGFRPALATILIVSFVSFLSFVIFASILLSKPVSAQPAQSDIQFFEITSILDEAGVSRVKMIVTFDKPVNFFSFSVVGNVENFTSSSTAGPISCSVQTAGVSDVNCILSLTQEKRQIELNFLTSDFVRPLGDKFFYSGDISLDRDVNSLVAILRLPRNAFPVGENETMGRISYPEQASTFISEDGSVTVNWRLTDFDHSQPLKLEVLYQQIQPPIWFQLRIRHFMLLGAAFAGVLGVVLFFLYRRKTEKVVLSVMDEFERMVIDAIRAEGGEDTQVKQKRIVDLTNLSKAKVSRVVKNLAERGLIEVERRGRTNRIKLVKKRFKV